MPKIIAPAEMIAKAKEKFPHLDFTNSNYLATKKPLTFVCPEHGEQQVSMFNQLMNSPYGCPTCAKEFGCVKPIPDQTWLSRLKAAHPEFTFTLDVTDEEIAHLAPNSRRMKMTRVSAPCGHTWITTCSSILDQKSGCRACLIQSREYQPQLQKAREARWAKYRANKSAGVDFSNSKFIVAAINNLKAYRKSRASKAQTQQTPQNT